MAVASQFITLSTTEWQLLPANAINLVAVAVVGTPNLECSGDGGTTTHQEIALGVGDTQITEHVLHYVKLSAGSGKLYYGVE